MSPTIPPGGQNIFTSSVSNSFGFWEKRNRTISELAVLAVASCPLVEVPPRLRPTPPPPAETSFDCKRPQRLANSKQICKPHLHLHKHLLGTLWRSVREKVGAAVPIHALVQLGSIVLPVALLQRVNGLCVIKDMWHQGTRKGHCKCVRCPALKSRPWPK
jgi:hypothetical protein